MGDDIQQGEVSPSPRCSYRTVMELRHGQRHGGSAVGTHVHAYAVADVPSSGNMPASRGPGRNPPLFEVSNQNKMTRLQESFFLKLIKLFVLSMVIVQRHRTGSYQDFLHYVFYIYSWQNVSPPA